MTGISFVRPVAVMAVLAIALGALLLENGRPVLGQEATATPTSGEPTAPPTPFVFAEPSEFLGTVTIDGQPASDGTPIEALIGDVVCGTATVSAERYDVSVRAGYGYGRDYQERCGNGGEAVAFRSGGRIANETGTFTGLIVQELDLTFGQALAPTLPDTGSGAPGSSAGAIPGVFWVLLAVAMAALVAGLAARKAPR